MNQLTRRIETLEERTGADGLTVFLIRFAGANEGDQMVRVSGPVGDPIDREEGETEDAFEARAERVFKDRTKGAPLRVMTLYANLGPFDGMARTDKAKPPAFQLNAPWLEPSIVTRNT